MKHDRRPVLVEDLAHLDLVAGVGEDRCRRMEDPLVDELALDLEQPRLAVVDEDEARRADARDLAAELGADRAACARDQHDLSLEVAGNRVEVDLDRLAPEQILDLDRADLPRQVEVRRDHLGEPGQGLHRYAFPSGDRDDALARLSSGGRDGDEQLVGLAVAEDVLELVTRPEHADPVQPQVLLSRIVVDEADRCVAEGRSPEHLAQDLLGCIPCADDDDLLAPGHDPPGGRALDDRAREKARAQHERQQEQQLDEPDSARDLERVEIAPEQREDHEDRDDRYGDTADRAPHVAGRDVPPPAVVEAEGDEDRNRDPDDERHDLPVEVALVAKRRLPVEADVPGEDPRGSHEPGVDADLPQPMPVQGRSHATRASVAASTVSTTRSCCSSEMPAQSGTEKFSFAARSVSGRSPSA